MTDKKLEVRNFLLLVEKNAHAHDTSLDGI